MVNALPAFNSNYMSSGVIPTQASGPVSGDNTGVLPFGNTNPAAQGYNANPAEQIDPQEVMRMILQFLQMLIQTMLPLLSQLGEQQGSPNSESSSAIPASMPSGGPSGAGESSGGGGATVPASTSASPSSGGGAPAATGSGSPASGASPEAEGGGSEETSPAAATSGTANSQGFISPLAEGTYRLGDGLGAGRNHGGQDMAAPQGTPVMAAKAGTITKVANDPDGYGQYIEIEHADGSKTRYAHMSRFGEYKQGQSVQAGNVIGAVGSTGRSTGPHLHFEVISPDGKKLEPRTITPV